MPKIPRNVPPVPWPSPPFPTEPPLTVGLADLAGWWLNIRCGCGQFAAYPLRLMAAERGWRTPLGDVLPRLRCDRCRKRPGSVELTDDPTLGASGVPSSGRGKRLRLV